MMYQRQMFMSTTQIQMLDLLDEYILQKMDNNFLSAWKSIKSCEYNNGNQISIQTFSKPNIRLCQSSTAFNGNIKCPSWKQIRYMTSGNQLEQVIDEENQRNQLTSQKNKPYEDENDDEDDEFEDLILKKLTNLQKDIEKIRINRSTSFSVKSQSTMKGETSRNSANSLIKHKPTAKNIRINDIVNDEESKENCSSRRNFIQKNPPTFSFEYRKNLKKYQSDELSENQSSGDTEGNIRQQFYRRGIQLQNQSSTHSNQTNQYQGFKKKSSQFYDEQLNEYPLVMAVTDDKFPTNMLYRLVPVFIPEDDVKSLSTKKK